MFVRRLIRSNIVRFKYDGRVLTSGGLMGATEAVSAGINYLLQDRKSLVIPGLVLGLTSALEASTGVNDGFTEKLLHLLKVEVPAPSPTLLIVAIAVSLIATLFVSPYVVERYRAFLQNEPLKNGSLAGKALRKMPGVLVASIAYGLFYGLLLLVALLPIILVGIIIPPLGIIVGLLFGIVAGLWLAAIFATALPAYIWSGNISAGFDLISTAWKNKMEFMEFGLVLSLLNIAGYAIGVGIFVVFAFLGFLPAAGFLKGVTAAAITVVSDVAAIEFLRNLRELPDVGELENPLQIDEALKYDPLLGGARF